MSTKPSQNPALAAKLEAERKLKEGISGHKTGLPKKLLELFEPLPPPPVLPDIPKRPPKLPYTGIAQYVDLFADPGDTEYEPPPEVPRPASPRRFRNPELAAQARVDYESKAEKKTRISAQKIASAAERVEEGLKTWEPAKDPNAQGDPFKTLFVARVSYDATEKKLKREFEEYGPVKRVSLIVDEKSGKPQGYAFIEFEHKNDMKTAYKMADGKKIEGRRVLVDVERGRTVPNWRPRRLGGGKGGDSRETKLPKDPARRGLITASAGTPGPPALAALPPPPISADRERDRDRDRERDREKERERERTKDREKERDRERDRAAAPREKERDRDGRSEKERDGKARDRDRERDRKREREDGERDRDRDRKRERRDENGVDHRRHEKGKDEREEGEHRSSRHTDSEKREDGERKRDRDERDRHRDRDDRSKKHREEERPHRRERDLV